MAEIQQGIGIEEKPTRKRLQILGLIFISVFINYMDRSNISVAAAAMSDDLKLTSVQMGIIFSAFAWTYSTLQIPGGLMVDRVKVRVLYPFIMIAWSLATIVQGLVSSFAAIIGCRMAIGVFEAPSYPCNSKIVATWFPENERASAIAVYTSAQFIGLAFLIPILALIQDAFGWRGLFVISGLIGIFWGVAWYFFYRDPQDHKSINNKELELINQDEKVNVTKEAKVEQKFSKNDFLTAFTSRKLWGIYIGQFCLGGTTMFFLTWFPTYLVEYRGLDFIKSGFLASLPFACGFCGVLFSGFLSDFLVRKGVSKEISRKTPVIVGMLLSIFIIGANYTDDTFWIITFLSIAFFGTGLSSIAWVFVSLLAPRRLLGLVGGCFNSIGGLSGVIVPVVIGFLVQDGDFKPALVFIGCLAVIGACSYMFLIGKIERVEIRGEENSAESTDKSVTSAS